VCSKFLKNIWASSCELMADAPFYVCDVVVFERVTVGVTF